MDELLQQYRRAARLKNVPECIRCLRLIVAEKPTGQVWMQDLEAYEARRLEQLRDLVPVVVAAGQAHAIEPLLKELASFVDTPLRRTLADDLTRALEKSYEEKLGATGLVLLDEAEDAWGQSHDDRLVAIVDQYRRLSDAAYFKPTPAMDQRFAGLFDRYTEITRCREQQLQVQTLAGELLAELARPRPGRRMMDIWKQITENGGAVPEDLAKAAKKAIRRYKRRTFVVRQVAVIALVAATVVASSLIAKEHQFRRARDLMGSQLDTQWNACMPDGFVLTIGMISSNYPILLDDRPIQARARRLSEFNAIFQARHTNFEGRLHALQASLEESGPWKLDALLKHSSEVDRLAWELSSAAAGLKPEAAARLRKALNQWGSNVPHDWQATAQSLASWMEKPAQLRAEYDQALARWQDFKKEHQGRIDRVFSALIEQGELYLSKVDPNQQDESALGPAREILANAAGMPGISSNLIQRLEDARARANALGAEMVRQSKMRAIQKADTVEHYLEAVRDYRSAMPDEPLSLQAQALLTNAPIYLSVPTPETASNIPSIHAPRLMWREWERARAKTWPSTQKKIMALGNEKRLVDLWKFSMGRWTRGEFQATTGYIEGVFSAKPFDPKRFAVAAGARPLIEGNVYFPRANEVEPSFQFAAFNRAQGQYVSKPELMPHCVFIEGLMGAIRATGASGLSPDQILAQQADRLARMTDIPPLLRLRLLQFLAAQIVDLAPQGARPLWSGFLDRARRIGDEINWICSENREVLAANAQAEDIIARHILKPALPRQYQLYVTALRESANIRPAWVGYAEWSAPKPRPVLTAGAEAAELWVFRPDILGGRQFVAWIVAAWNDAGQWQTATPLKPGEPLFAPSEGPGTCARIEQWRRELDLPAPIPPALLPGWPQQNCPAAQPSL